MNTQKKPYHHGDLASVILDEATKMLASHDASEISLRELARRLGVSHQAPYAHFKSKEELFSVMIIRGFREIEECSLAALEQHNDARSQLKMSGLSYIRFATSHPQLLHLMFQKKESVADEIKVAKQAAFAALIKIMHGGAESGVFRKENPFTMAQVAWSYIHGLSVLLIQNAIPSYPDGTDAIDSFFEANFEIFLKGLDARKG